MVKSKHLAEPFVFLITFVPLQVVRPHAPLIKFPDRKGVPRPNGQ